ncbi:MAG: hypothetical protein H7Z43_12115, partial [Clostridia bacterium]|nr:hypothetical protein [Deltaproteobacteria bacterium]
MALDLRLQQKMSQQLVMTPQLQQAIKLLQLSHLEMAEVLRKEMEENPTLEEGEAHEKSELDRSSEPESMETRGQAEGDYESSGESYSLDTSDTPNSNEYDGSSSEYEPSQTGGAYEGTDYEVTSAGTASAQADTGVSENSMESRSVSDAPLDATPEPSSSDVNREVDWESYLDTYNYALPATAGPGNSDDLPPFEATMSQ